MTHARSAWTVKGYAASVENVSVKANLLMGEEREYVDGADRETVTFGVFGREVRVSKTIVSLPLAACQGIVGVAGVGSSDADSKPPGLLEREVEVFTALTGQCEIGVVGLKHSLYFLFGRRAVVMNGISQDLLGLPVVKMTSLWSSRKRTGAVRWRTTSTSSPVSLSTHWINWLEFMGW